MRAHRGPNRNVLEVQDARKLGIRVFEIYLRHEKDRINVLEGALGRMQGRQETIEAEREGSASKRPQKAPVEPKVTVLRPRSGLLSTPVPNPQR